MIGSGFKKLAAENGMKVSNGVAYGSLRGYAATLTDGSNCKQIVISTKFEDPEKVQQLQAALNQKNIAREFRVQNLIFAPAGIQIVFTDNPGTLKKIAAFIDWFFPLLDSHGAQGVNVCSECGGQITGGCWKLVNGVACHMHEGCAEKVRAQLSAEDADRKSSAAGSYATGLLGALGGSLIGSVLWAIVLNLGYVASLVGLVIGWLAEKGYNLLRGKQGKAKIAILILAIVLGVLVGTFAADVFTLVEMINNDELLLTYGEIPSFLMTMLTEVEEYRSAVISNILMGLLFAALGVGALLYKAGKAVADNKFVDLK